MSAAAAYTPSPLAKRLQEMREMRAYWAGHIDRHGNLICNP